MPNQINNTRFDKMIDMFREANENTSKLVNGIEKREVTVRNEQARIEKQGSVLKQFVEKESPLIAKIIKFKAERKEGREGGKLRNLISAKTFGPAVIKGLSLGLMKFGAGGAIGAAKIIDVVEGYQSFSKEQEKKTRESSLTHIDNLIKEGKLEKEDIISELKSGNMTNREARLAFETYQDRINSSIKEVVQKGIESGKSNEQIVKALEKQSLIKPSDEKKKAKIKKILAKQENVVKPSEQQTTKTIVDAISSGDSDSTTRLDLIAEEIEKNKMEIINVQEYIDLLVDTGKESNSISIERAGIDNDRLRLERQIEQNNAIRHQDLMDKDKDDDKDGIFGKLLGSFSGISTAFTAGTGMLSSAVPLLSSAAAVMGPALLAAGTAFAAFKAGGYINDWLNIATEKLTGEEGATVGGKIFDAKEGIVKGFKSLFDLEDTASEIFGASAVEKARKRGFGGETADEFSKFIDEETASRRKTLDMEQINVAKKAKLQETVKMADNARVEAEIAERTKLAKGQLSEENLAAALTKALKGNLNVDVKMPMTPDKRLNDIPSNADDLPLSFIAKGGMG